MGRNWKLDRRRSISLLYLERKFLYNSGHPSRFEFYGRFIVYRRKPSFDVYVGNDDST